MTALRADGHTVRTLRTAHDGPGLVAPTDPTVFVGGLHDEASLDAPLRGVEVVFHCEHVDDPRAMRASAEKVNLIGTENLLAACRRAKVRRVVHLSTADVTQSLAPRPYVDEDLPQPADFLDACTETRALAEDLVVAASDEHLETVTLRPGWLWGVGDAALAPGLAAAVRDGTFRWIDDGRALCATTNVANLVAAMRLAATVPDAAGRLFYITDDERITVREFLTRLAAATGLKLPRASTPFALAYGLAWLGERVSSVGARSRREVVAHGRSAHFNVQRARKELGYAPVVDVSEGLRRVKEHAERGAPSGTAP